MWRVHRGRPRSHDVPGRDLDLEARLLYEKHNLTEANDAAHTAAVGFFVKTGARDEEVEGLLYPAGSASALASGSSMPSSDSRSKVVDTMKKISSRKTTSISGVRLMSGPSRRWWAMRTAQSLPTCGGSSPSCSASTIFSDSCSIVTTSASTRPRK